MKTTRWIFQKIWIAYYEETIPFRLKHLVQCLCFCKFKDVNVRTWYRLSLSSEYKGSMNALRSFHIQTKYSTITHRRKRQRKNTNSSSGIRRKKKNTHKKCNRDPKNGRKNKYLRRKHFHSVRFINALGVVCAAINLS